MDLISPHLSWLNFVWGRVPAINSLMSINAKHGCSLKPYKMQSSATDQLIMQYFFTLIHHKPMYYSIYPDMLCCTSFVFCCLGQNLCTTMIWSVLSVQDSSQPLSCKNEDFSKSCYEKPPKQTSFQIHVDEPEGACTKKPQQVVEPVKSKTITEESPLTINNAVARLRQPLATIDIPSAMDVSFGGFHILIFDCLNSCNVSISQHSWAQGFHLLVTEYKLSLSRLPHGHVCGWGRGETCQCKWSPRIRCWNPQVPEGHGGEERKANVLTYSKIHCCPRPHGF